MFTTNLPQMLTFSLHKQILVNRILLWVRTGSIELSNDFTTRLNDGALGHNKKSWIVAIVNFNVDNNFLLTSF